MARSPLEKLFKGQAQPRINDKLRIIPGGKTRESAELLTDNDWYYVHGFWKSSLFDQTYMKLDFQRLLSREFAKQEEGFQQFLGDFMDLCENRRTEKFYTWNEDQTIRSWIMPVMEALGWWDKNTDPVIPELSYSISNGSKKKTFRPDCAFVASNRVKGAIQEKDASERIELARKYVILTLEAKYWDRIRSFDSVDGEIEDSPKSRKSDSASSLSPSGQILTYLRHFKNDGPNRNHFGIVTDGKVWRLHHVDRPEDKYFEFDLGDLFRDVTSTEALTSLTPKQYRIIEEAARYFYFVFSKAALFHAEDKPTIVDGFYLHSQKYADQAKQDLQVKFVNAMKIACNGFSRALKKSGVDQDRELVRDLAESHIFNILFLKSCEAKGVIRYEDNTSISITSIVERIHGFDADPSIDDFTNESLNLRSAFSEFDYVNHGSELHGKILKLTNLVQNGGSLSGGIEIDGFKQSIFSNREKSLIQNSPLSNIETVKLLFELGYMEESGNLRQIPYNQFTPEQLGSIYESFLEYKLFKADEDIEYIKHQWLPISKKTFDNLKKGLRTTHPIARSGELYFAADNIDRKASGSYYTPDPVVKEIIHRTLGSALQKMSANDILKFRICDPAMGSGHFLTGALRYVTNRYLEALENEPVTRKRTPIAAKRDILENCIFGADLNPRAVRLAKMALWLETVHPGAKLEHLDDQLKCGNSLQILKGKKVSSFSWSREFADGFDAIIGNPPYGATLPRAEIHGYSKQLSIPISTVDTYILFCFQCLDLCKETGSIGLIIPSTWLYMGSFKEVRAALWKRGFPSNIVHYKESIFEDATVETCIAVSHSINKPTKEIEYIEVKSGLKISEDNALTFAVESEAVASESLVPKGDRSDAELFEMLSNSSMTVGDIAKVVCGLTPYRLGKGKPAQTEQIVKDKAYDADYKKTDKHRQYVMGRDFTSFSWSIQKERWIKYGDNLAEPRYAAPYDDKKKVIVRQTADTLIAHLDDKKFLNLKNVHNIKMTRNDIPLECVVGILNSQLARWWYEKLVPEKGRTFAEVKAVNLRKVPIWPKGPVDPKKVQELTSVVSKILDDPKSQPNLVKLNELIFDLFKITSKQRKEIVRYMTQKKDD